MTLVGDIHQNLNPRAGLRSWSDIGLPNVKRATFAMNYRQTLQLGTFMNSLHSGLFEESCDWSPSPKLSGALPRIGVSRSWRSIASAVATEVKYWRENIGGSGTTVAVLYDGRPTPKRLKWFQKQLAKALQDELVSVLLAMPNTGGEVLRRTDQVVIASVRQTKGLEFDAVIYVESKPRWVGPIAEIDLRTRNGFYVATSRARAGLSICMSNLPQCVPPLVALNQCILADWSEREVADGEFSSVALPTPVRA
jgi:hypothetical protein